jgi:hypothetical protein
LAYETGEIMLTSIRIEGFRGFRAFRVDGLRRVNLFVGRNNAGKTRLLEAVELLLRPDTIGALWAQPVRRNEVIRGAPGESPGAMADVRHLFSGHALSTGKDLRVEGGGDPPRKLWVQLQAEQPPRNGGTKPSRHHASNLWLTYSVTGEVEVADTWDLSPSGGLSQPLAPPETASAPVCFVGAGSWDEAWFVALWEDMVLTSAEKDVLRAVQLVEPRIERIAAAHDSFVIRLADGAERVPVGAMGDGVRRILALAIQLARSVGGALLIDEVDTGLHHSVMRPVWRFLIEAALRLDVQVFTTSHSLDCLSALAGVCEEPDVPSELVAVHRLEPEEETVTTYSAEELQVAIAQEMEIR